MAIRLACWEPENAIFWQKQGRRIASRNLVLSTCSLHLNFNIWMMWSMVVVNLPAIGFSLTEQQAFLLVAIPGLVGALMRLLYAFAWTWIGGGSWMGISTLFLLLPALGVAHVVQDVSTPFPMLLAVAACCGIGCGASASHLANINFFYPKSSKGFAMGINAGLGNLGVSVAQLLVAVLISVKIWGLSDCKPQCLGKCTAMHTIWLQNAGYFFVPLIVVVALACLLFSHDLPRLKLTPRDQVASLKHAHTWYISLPYLSSYGTFLGFSAAFPLLAHVMFPQSHSMEYAFVGPMVCALSRPLGGWLGDRFGAGITTVVSNAAMGLGTLGLIVCLPGANGQGSFWLFFALFQWIFMAAGIGNGSSYQLGPKVFMLKAAQDAQTGGCPPEDAYARGGREGALAMSFSAVFAALGGFFIPKSFGTSLILFNSFVPGFVMFFCFYLVSSLVVWQQYGRPGSPMRC